MTTLLGIAIALIPFASVVALLRMMERRESRRAETIERQIVLTNAIHREFGAVTAPTVERRRGQWLVHMRVPVERPALVAALVAIAEKVFARYEAREAGRVRIVLTPATADAAMWTDRGRFGAPALPSRAKPAFAAVR